MIRLLVLMFVVSGMAGLMYESIWTRYLGLFVGHSAYAQIVVLVIFLGGMSLGALAVGRRSERVREPLLGYAAVEAVVGLIGLAFHPLYLAITGAAHDTWFPAVAGTAWLSVIKWGLAAALILPQSVLLGATFPLMSAGVIRRTPRTPGRQLAVLYFANSLGAAVGVLVSGFVLVETVGLPGTILAAAILNLAVAIGVAVLVARERRAGRPAAAAQPEAATEAGGDGLASHGRRKAARASGSAPARESAPAPVAAAPRLLLTIAFGTAVASFIYEIGWIRMLSLVLGGATHAFEVMLSAFILGLALGALWVRSRADRFREPLRALGILQFAMGALAMATLPLYLASFDWVGAMVRGLPPTDQGYRLFTLGRYGICLAVMLPATFCAGTTLPLITRMLMRSAAGERAIGVVYAVNTVGSILGAAAAGLWLMPWLGLKGLLMCGALIDIGLGIAALAARARAGNAPLRGAAWASAAAAALTLAIGAFVRFDQPRLTSGVYRTGTLITPGQAEIRYYRDGRTATVSLEEATRDGKLSLTTNGKVDASVRPEWKLPVGQRPRMVLLTDESTQMLLPLVALAHVPHARQAAVIGHGSGMSSHTLLGSPRLERVTTIEIEREVVHASRGILPANRRVFEDPRSEMVIDDAKSFFAASGRRYDLILSEPSNPWVSGVAGLFSTEFYRRVRATLTPDGVMGQWLHIYENNDALALSVVAAVQENFRDYEIFLVDETDMLIVATNRPAGLEPDWAIMALPGIASEFAHVPPLTPTTFEAMRVANRRVLEPLAARVRPNSDFHPLVDLGAERARFQRQMADGFVHLHGDRMSLAAMMLDRRVEPVPTPMVAAPGIPRVRFLAIGSVLRSGWRLPANAAGVDPLLPAAIERRAALDSTLAGDVPPPDWRTWTMAALHAEEDAHLGTSGWVDEAFHARVRAYLERVGAPEPVRRTFAFVHAVSARDFRTASALADPLVAEAAGGESWLPPGLLLDAATAAKLLSGDRDGARRVSEALRPVVERGPDDLRSRLLAAHLGTPDPATR